MVRRRHWRIAREGLGIALQPQVPARFGAIGWALIRHYGFTEQTAQFLLLHVSVDEDHGDVTWQILRQHAEGEALQRELKERASRPPSGSGACSTPGRAAKYSATAVLRRSTAAVIGRPALQRGRAPSDGP